MKTPARSKKKICVSLMQAPTTFHQCSKCHHDFKCSKMIWKTCGCPRLGDKKTRKWYCSKCYPDRLDLEDCDKELIEFWKPIPRLSQNSLTQNAR